MHKVLPIIGGIIGFIYLLNPTAGVFEVIPDALPIIGNLDEAAATILVLGALRALGIDLTKAFSSKAKLPDKSQK